jgi:ubiquinone biosynthesis protein
VKPLGFYHNAVRVKEVFAVLARQGFAGLLGQIDPKGRWWSRWVPRTAARRTLWERVRLSLEELGPTFVKMGQLMGSRPDMLPHGLILELRKLQNAVSPLPFSEMRPVLEGELGAGVAEVFGSFDETCVASASLAQVYFATLKDGREVAVKVQRPQVQRQVQTDLELLAWLAGQVHQRVPLLRPYDLPGVAAEVREGMLRELDYEHEARNQRYFNTLNPHPEKVFAPEVFGGLSGRRVLVMERVRGRVVADSVFSPEEGRRLAAAGASSLVHQILITGFFHADPHEGNVVVMDDGRICFLDWGMAGNLTRRMRHGLADLLLAAVNQDPERVVQVAMDLGGTGRADARAMERDVTLALREHFNTAIGHMEIGRAMLKLLFIFGRNGVPLSRDYSLVAKAVLAIEETAWKLDPTFDLKDDVRPVLLQLQRERTGPLALAREGRAVARSFLGTLRELPGEISQIVRRVQQDDLTIKFEHKGLEELDDAVSRASSRITLGVIIAALIVSSSLIITTHVEPFLLGYPALGIIGYVLSALLGLYVIWDIVRHGRHR